MEYPSTPKPCYPIDITPRWQTVVSPFDSGKEQRRSKQVQDLYDVVLTYDKLSLADFDTLWNFYQSCKGKYQTFYYYDQEENRRTWTEVYCGLGDGSTTIFDLPGKNTSGQSVFFNGALQGSGYTILTGGGAESSDRIEFTSAPLAGIIITASFTGDLRIKCRFKEDKLTRRNFIYRLYTTGIELYGLPA